MLACDPRYYAVSLAMITMARSTRGNIVGFYAVCEDVFAFTSQRTAGLGISWFLACEVLRNRIYACFIKSRSHAPHIGHCVWVTAIMAAKILKLGRDVVGLLTVETRESCRSTVAVRPVAILANSGNYGSATCQIAVISGNRRRRD